MNQLFSFFLYNNPKSDFVLPPKLHIDWERQQTIQCLVESMDLMTITRNESTVLRTQGSDWVKVFGDLELVETGGSGDCQFTALSWTLFGRTENYQLLRSLIARHMRRNEDRFVAARNDVVGKSFATHEEYCKAIEFTALWGNHATLQACADIFKVKIQVLSSLAGGSKFPLVVPFDTSPCDPTPIFLGHISELHYQGIDFSSDIVGNGGAKRKRRRSNFIRTEAKPKQLKQIKKRYVI